MRIVLPTGSVCGSGRYFISGLFKKECGGSYRLKLLELLLLY